MMRPDPDTCRDPDLLAAEVRRLRAAIDSGSPTLTDEEREAVAYCVSCAQDYRETLDCCEQSEKYDRATRMIDAAMRLVILTVGPAPVERPSAARVTDVGGAGPT
jgi:hypothetical protein